MAFRWMLYTTPLVIAVLGIVAEGIDVCLYPSGINIPVLPMDENPFPEQVEPQNKELLYIYEPIPWPCNGFIQQIEFCFRRLKSQSMPFDPHSLFSNIYLAHYSPESDEYNIERDIVLRNNEGYSENCTTDSANGNYEICLATSSDVGIVQVHALEDILLVQTPKATLASAASLCHIPADRNITVDSSPSRPHPRTIQLNDSTSMKTNEFPQLRLVLEIERIAINPPVDVVTPSMSPTSPGPTAGSNSSTLSVPLVASVAGGGALLLIICVVVVVIIVVAYVRMKRQALLAGGMKMHGLQNRVYSSYYPNGDDDKIIPLNHIKLKRPSVDQPLPPRPLSICDKQDKTNTIAKGHDYAVVEEMDEEKMVPHEYSYAVAEEDGFLPDSPLSAFPYKYPNDAYPSSPSEGSKKRSMTRQETSIYIPPANDEGTLYRQFRRMRIAQIKSKEISITDHLGSGQFGNVSKGVWTTASKCEEVAVKTLKPGMLEVDKVKFLQEAAIMGQFVNPNIVKLHGMVIGADPIMIVLELLTKGDLSAYLCSLRPGSNEMVDEDLPHTLLSYCRQIASGMSYLASKDFIHRDLAARNILVSSDGATCKIADFGMSRDLMDENYYISHGGKIPVKWTAPEALHYKKYSTASDVWSFGVVMYEIWSLGHKPFEGYRNAEYIRMIERGVRLPPPPGCSRPIYGLMVGCWHSKASSRPAITDVEKTLALPDHKLLKWKEEGKVVATEASSLGLDIDTGLKLYKDLQNVYLPEQSYDDYEDMGGLTSSVAV